MTELLYLGDWSCRITSSQNTVLYINPDKGKDYSRKADIILQTTETNKSLVQLHITTDQTKIINPVLLGVGDKFNYQDIQIERIADGAYRISVDDKRILVCGKQDIIAEGADDYALVPILQTQISEGKMSALAKQIIPVHTSEVALFDYRVAIALRVENKLIIEPSMMIDLQEKNHRNLKELDNQLYPLLLDAAEKFHMTMICMNDGYAMAQMLVTKKDINPLGLVYGGISYNFADIVAGCTFYSAGGYGPTVSANYEYLRSTADTESLVAIAKDIKRGKHIHFIEVEIYNDMAKLVAKGGFTYYVQK